MTYLSSSDKSNIKRIECERLGCATREPTDLRTHDTKNQNLCRKYINGRAPPNLVHQISLANSRTVNLEIPISRARLRFQTKQHRCNWWTVPIHEHVRLMWNWRSNWSDQRKGATKTWWQTFLRNGDAKAPKMVEQNFSKFTWRVCLKVWYNAFLHWSQG